MKPARKAAPEVAAPAPLAGLEQNQPPAADWKAAIRAGNLQCASAVTPALPHGGIRPRIAVLNGATRLTSADILNPWAPPLRRSPGRLEIREFARMEPVIEFRPLVDPPHVPAADQAITLSFLATALQAEPKLWVEQAREFGSRWNPAEETAFLETLTA